MATYLRWLTVAALTVSAIFAAWLKRNGHLQIVATQHAIHQAKAQGTSTAQADSGVIFVSAKQINSEIHKVSESDPAHSLCT